MSVGTVAQDDRARNWSPSMRRAFEAMRRYPMDVCKPARLDSVCKSGRMDTVCAACGCPMQRDELPDDLRFGDLLDGRLV